MDDDNDSGGRIIITTRKLEVAAKAEKVYKLQPLPNDMSRELFIRRISGHEGKYVPDEPDEILDKFIRKCSGIPLAIITMASLLAGKKRDEWPDLYNTIDFGSKDNKEAENTMRTMTYLHI
jgi:disease resistance protein RPM1